jgi:hypothetical protein
MASSLSNSSVSCTSRSRGVGKAGSLPFLVLAGAGGWAARNFPLGPAVAPVGWGARSMRFSVSVSVGVVCVVGILCCLSSATPTCNSTTA